MQEGKFRQDLYYRLRVVPIDVPPLRGRPEDIPVLVRHFLRELSPEQGLSVDPEVDAVLMNYAWPGNVRELRNAIERMVLLRETDHLSLRDVPEEIRSAGRAGHDEFSFELPARGLDLMKFERHIIVETLRMLDGNQSAAARYLNIPRHVLVYRLEKFEIEQSEYLDS